MKPWENTEQWKKHKIGQCRFCQRRSVCKNYKAGLAQGCSGLFSPSGEEIKEPSIDGVVVEGTVEWVFTRKNSVGKDYWVITLDGEKLYCWFNPGCKKGDYVKVIYKQNGDFANIVSLVIE